MLNPNICKRVKVQVVNGRGYVDGAEIRINETGKPVADGWRYFYLKYSIHSDSYYLTRKG